MSNHIAWALQKTIMSALKSYAPLTALLPSQHIYDAVPPRSPYPYLTLGPIRVKDRSAAQHRAHEHQIVLIAFSRSPGFREVYALAQEVEAALSHAPLVLEGHELTLLHFESVEFRRENDALTSRALMTYRALTQSPTLEE